MSGSARASVVIPTYQRRRSVERALKALASQTVPADAYEVVVSIDGSRDGTEEMLERFPARYPLRWVSRPNGGRAAACNAGAEQAGGELLVFLDDDMEPVPGFLAAHLNAHAGDYPRGVVGAAPIRCDDSSPSVVSYRATGFRNKLRALAEKNSELRFSEVYTGNFSIPRALFFAVGGFDESFRRYGHEDYELALRLKHRDVALTYDAHALAVQHFEKDFTALARSIFQEGQTAVELAAKHPEALSELPLSRLAELSPRVLRRLRWMLPLASLWSGFPVALIRPLAHLESRLPTPGHAFYRRAFDCFYWLGVQRELRMRGERGGSPEALGEAIQRLVRPTRPALALPAAR